MPIRFRCVYCNKLLGIARRKGGAVVNCPECNQPLIVPTPEAEQAPALSSSHRGHDPIKKGVKLFERDDFDSLIDQLPGSAKASPKAEAKSPSPLLDDSEEDSALTLTKQSGYLLTNSQVVWIGSSVLILIALAFVGGYFAGRH